MKKGSFERALRTRLIMPLCGTLIIIINKTWLDDYYNGDPEMAAQVTVSKDLNQPIILMIDQDLTPPERKQVDNIFQKHNVVTTIIFDPDNLDKSKTELRKALDAYTKKTNKC